MKKRKRRSSTFSIPDGFELGTSPIYVRGYDTAGKFVCRLEINSAGVNIVAGTKGKKKLQNVTWERLVELLDAENQK